MTENDFYLKWEEYLKAFTDADYEKLGTQFHFPVTLLFEQPIILENKASFLEAMKFIREHKLQDGYAYSKTDTIHWVQLSDSEGYIDAKYSRYNHKNEIIFQGRGLYFFKKSNSNWKIQVNMPIG
ncbi:hypothetical protein [Aquirufa sp. 5-AUSEE-100C1]